MRKAIEECAGDEAVQHSVPQKFETLVVARTVAAMGEGLPQKLRIAETIADPRFRLWKGSCTAAMRLLASAAVELEAAKSMHALTFWKSGICCE